MDISITRGSLTIEVGESEGFIPPKKARFGGERFLKDKRDYFVMGGGQWLVPTEDGETHSLEEIDNASHEKLMPLIIEAAKEKGIDIEVW